jgi:hypothetical protein
MCVYILTKIYYLFHVYATDTCFRETSSNKYYLRRVGHKQYNIILYVLSNIVKK